MTKDYLNLEASDPAMFDWFDNSSGDTGHRPSLLFTDSKT